MKLRITDIFFYIVATISNFTFFMTSNGQLDKEACILSHTYVI